MYKDNELVLRPIERKDLPHIWRLVYKEEAPEWKQWDAPYYPHASKSYEDFMKTAESLIGDDSMWVIEVSGECIGTVSYYWEHAPSKWLETGIILYESVNWGRGMGTRALRMWISHLFNTMPLIRAGLTTWSGNERMIRVGEKLGMQMEARIRKVRYYNNHYYDSIRMGVLREEWEDRYHH